MPQANLGAVTLEYESFGDPTHSAVLLIMGVGAQLTLWPTSFCEGLAAQGLHIIRFDNRDVGKSTHLMELGIPDLRAISDQAARGEPVSIPYSLDDMAADVIRLMEVLETPSAHLVGVSLGGMIGQLAAVRHGDRVRSLVSIMSTTSRRELPPARPEAMAAIMTPPPSQSRDDLIATRMHAMRAIQSPKFAASDEELLARVAESVDRVPFEPTGTLRQMAAIFAAPSRHEMLRGVRCPALVIHGADDPLIPLPAGEDTARCIPGAQLCVIPGMAHDITHALVPVLLGKIAPFLLAVEGGRSYVQKGPLPMEWR